MAETTTAVDLELNDKELFQEAIAQDEPVKKERPRDLESGRYIAAEKETQPEAKAEPERAEQPAAAQEVAPETKDDSGPIPSWRLREVSEARRDAEQRAEQASRQYGALQEQFRSMQAELQRLKQPEAPKQPVDFFADPDGALKQHLTPIEERFARLEQDMRLSISRTNAIAVHGKDAVAEMEAAIEKAIAANDPQIAQLSAQVRQSADPANTAMQWFNNKRIMDEIGGDISSYKEKLKAELLKDKDFIGKAIESTRNQAAAQGKTVLNLPPNLSRTAAASASAGDDDNDTSDEGLFRNAMRR